MAKHDLTKTPVLVLNASYEPINICSAKRALVLLKKNDDTAIIERASDRVLHTTYEDIPVPSVIRLLEFRRIPRSTRSVSRKSILARDRYTCQYCKHSFESKQLTLDHIQPRSRAGASSWDNLVAACYPCNNKKGGRTPEEAEMPLAYRPVPFSVHTNRHLLREAGMAQRDWQEYLFYRNTTSHDTTDARVIV